MTARRIMVISPDSQIEHLLQAGISTPTHEVATVSPGPKLVDQLRRRRPDIAVIDRVHERAGVVEMEIALLKDICPEVRIIAVSANPSVDQAGIIEQGIFYYLGTSAGPELIRVVEAAIQAVSKSKREAC